MGKFDTSTIEGFDQMDADQLREVISGIEMPEDNSAEMKKLNEAYQKVKASFDKTASELADAKKKAKASMTAEELAKDEREREMNELREQYESLLKESTVAKYQSKFIGLGMDESTAEKAASAMSDGDSEKIFDILASFKASFEKSVRADVIRQSPKPETAGAGMKYTSKEEIMKIKRSDLRQKAIAENPELFGLNE